MHIHAFSPLEIWQGAATLGRSLPDFLAELRDAGLGSLPGTAAEILDDEVRAIICPDKVTTAQWLEVMEAAHGVGLRTTSRSCSAMSTAPSIGRGICCGCARLQAADRRLHRVRAAAVRADGGADLSEGPLRGSARPCARRC